MSLINYNLFEFILGSLVSEKSTTLNEKENKYIFKVLNTANKKEIAQSINFLFNVEVESVNIVNVKGKIKRHRGRIGRRRDYRKAYVSIKSNQSINFDL